MSVPLGLAIRVGNMNRGLPYPVNVHLPSTVGPESRTSSRTSGPELDIVIPDCEERHTALGMFMDSWSQLEQHLHSILSVMLGIEFRPGEAIFSTMGMKQISDAIAGLAMRKFPDQSPERLINLTERLMKLNSKRNVLVHGHWVLEANIVVKRGEAMLVTQFLRCSTPLDPKLEQAMGDPRNQKERVRYSFSIKRIHAASRDTDTLKKDFGDVINEMGLKPVFPKRGEDQQPVG
jgi:hypothetical protein